jgi:hypothetical protein
MNDRRYVAMQQAVGLALSGRCRNWWTVQARMRVSGCQAADLEWTSVQRDWLDRLCAQARLNLSADGGRRSSVVSGREDRDDAGDV